MMTRPSTALPWTLLLTLCLAACGGGGGGETAQSATPATPSTPTTPQPPVVLGATVLTGTVSAGIIAQAAVAVFDASTYTSAQTGQPIATTTTNASGVYEVTLPAGFAKTVLIRASGKADGSSTVRDEVFGLTPITDSFVMLSVVPAAQVGPAGGRASAHVTAYTHAMAAYVGNKLGQADIDDAAVAARAQVRTHLTGGADPLTTVPTQAAMVALLASASNIAKASTSTVRNDPYGCTAKTSNADKIACTLKTVAAILQPLALASNASATGQLNLAYATALGGAAKGLDLAVVAANTGLSALDLAAGKSAATAALDQTEAAALAAAVAADGGAAVLPLIGVKIQRAGQLIIASGPQAGSYQGWTYALSRCLDDQTSCLDFNVQATISPEDVLEDPELVADAGRAAGELAQEVSAIQRAVYAKGRAAYPPLQTFIDVINAAVKQGLSAQSVAAAAAAARAGLAAAGFPVEATTADAGAAPTATAEQIAAAKACMLPEAYDNPSAPVFDPQLDSNCRLAQVNACIHRAGITAYDEQGRAACRIVNGLMATLTGTWRCGYCSPSYPF